MSKNPRGQFRWLVGCIVSASLLGACGAPENEGSAQANGEKLAMGAQELAAQDVRVSLSADKATVGAQEAVTVTVTLTNASRHPVKLLKWYTPADGLEEALFQVTQNGEPVAFIGPHYKRPAPQEKDYLRLAPGESLTSTVELSGLYDLSKTGSYSIRYEVGSQKSNDVTLWIEGRSSDPQAGGDVTGQVTSSIAFTGRCSTDQQTTLLSAVNAASAMANDAKNYLSSTTPSGTPRYTTWFGAFSSGGWSTATNHFLAIADAFDTKPLTLDCSCKKNYYAYVYPTRPYIIYVCSVFWNAPLTGTDSKGGTLIHEMSHFTVVAGTDDWVYGQSGAKSLAISDPTKALNNADNHEYFSENTPFQQ